MTRLLEPDTVMRGYLAGMLDGEGCLTITKRMPRGGQNYSYRAECIISNRHLGMLEALQTYIGGSLHTQTTASGAVKCHTLRLTRGDTERLLDLCEAHLIVKRDQARVMREFLATMPPGRRLTDDATQARRSELHQTIMDLHASGGRPRRSDWQTENREPIPEPGTNTENQYQEPIGKMVNK